MNKSLVSLFASVTLFAAFPAYSLSEREPVIAEGTVIRVIDGDTYDIRIDNPSIYEQFKDDARGDSRRERYVRQRSQSIRVRLASIDTAESVHVNPERNSVRGKQSSSVVSNMLSNQPVSVKCYDWGRYGRSICNVEFLYQGQPTDLGEWLIKNGHSEYVSKWGRNPYKDREYREAQRQAR
ncbi:hypothetical protein LCGC14_0282260 [marine sediment metagenome]|uniref:TNase-like domain-containing protein n=1 Tax=marine sediment metagenome TaxID=412755 RepID=A0A0F9UCE1_9ZZZZ